MCTFLELFSTFCLAKNYSTCAYREFGSGKPIDHVLSRTIDLARKTLNPCLSAKNWVEKMLLLLSTIKGCSHTKNVQNRGWDWCPQSAIQPKWDHTVNTSAAAISKLITPITKELPIGYDDKDFPAAGFSVNFPFLFFFFHEKTNLIESNSTLSPLITGWNGCPANGLIIPVSCY